MVKKTRSLGNLTIKPLTMESWGNFEELFSPNKVCASCWCMWWREKNREFSGSGNEEKKEDMRTIVQSGKEPGLIAYSDGIPVGWVSVAPRAEYYRLETNKAYYPVDDLLVWSMPCFFIHKDFRHMGLMEKLISAAVDYAEKHSAIGVEAYPFDIHEKLNAGTIYTGVVSEFYKQGFLEVARRKERNPIVRKMF
jgi:GNAT superfamily N-acetyltransferase